MRVTVRLVDAASGAEFQRASFEQPASQYLTLGDSLAQKAAVFLRERLGAEVRIREQRQRASNPQAWILVQRAEAIQPSGRLPDVMPIRRQRRRAFDQADSLLAQAATLDPKWTEPLVQRGTIASQQVRLVNTDPVLAAPYITKGLGFVDQALALDPQDADALFQRGELRYWRWLLGLEADPVAADRLLEAAQADFELARQDQSRRRRGRGRRSATCTTRPRAPPTRSWRRGARTKKTPTSPTSTRSSTACSTPHTIWPSLPTRSSGATRASGASRPTTASPCATSACLRPGRRRQMCRAPGGFGTAWRRSPPSRSEQFRTLTAQMTVAAVLARAKLADSARHVAQRSRGTTEIDPTHDLAEEEAYVYTLLGDNKAAFKALRTYWTANPTQQKAMAESAGWKFESLSIRPRMEQGGRGPLTPRVGTESHSTHRRTIAPLAQLTWR